MSTTATVEAPAVKTTGTGTQTFEESFDPTGGDPTPAPESDNKPASEVPSEDGDATVGGKTAGGEQPAGKPGEPSTKTGDPDPAGAEDDPTATVLSYYDGLAGKAKPAETEGKPKIADEITPDKLKAEIESATQDPTERFNKLLSKTGAMGNELGTLRKRVSEFEASPLKALEAATEKLGADKVQDALRESLGMALVPVEVLEQLQQAAQTPGTGGDDDVTSQVADKVLQEFARELELTPEAAAKLSLDEKLDLIEGNRRVRLRFQSLNAETIATRQREGERKAAESMQRQEQTVTEINTTLQELSTSVPHFKELLPVMKSIHKELRLDRVLDGIQAVDVYRKLAEVNRISVVLKQTVEATRQAERKRFSAALKSMGMTDAQAEKLLTPKPAANPANPPARKPAGDGQGVDWLGVG